MWTALLVQIWSWIRPIVHSWVYEIKTEMSLKLKVVMEKFQTSESLRIEETNDKNKQTLLNNGFT